MEILKKSAQAKQAELTPEELALINGHTLRELTAEEVFTFRLAACNDQVDRDHERFTLAALEGLAEKFPGRPVLLDHRWSAGAQTARIYAASVEARGAVHQLVLRCYMPRNDSTRDAIAAIEGGILKECSVGCSVSKVTCSICGAEQTRTLCEHIPGREYGGQLCVMELDEVADCYEASFVPVPAQLGAGTLKSKRYGGAEAPANPPVRQDWRLKEAVVLEAEKYRFCEEEPK